MGTLRKTLVIALFAHAVVVAALRHSVRRAPPTAPNAEVLAPTLEDAEELATIDGARSPGAPPGSRYGRSHGNAHEPPKRAVHVGILGEEDVR